MMSNKDLLAYCIAARKAVEKPAVEVTREDRRAVSMFSIVLMGSGTRLRCLQEFDEALRTLVSLGVYKKEARILLSIKGRSRLIEVLGYFESGTLDYQIPPSYKKTLSLYIELRTEFIRRYLAATKDSRTVLFPKEAKTVAVAVT